MMPLELKCGISFPAVVTFVEQEGKQWHCGWSPLALEKAEATLYLAKIDKAIALFDAKERQLNGT